MIAIVKNYLKPYAELIKFDPDPHRSRGQVNQTTRKTMRCQHCGRHEILPKDGEISDVGDLCRHCWQFICPRCVKLGSCNPLERHLEECERTGLNLNPYRLPET